MNRATITLGYAALSLVAAVLVLVVGTGTANAEHCGGLGEVSCSGHPEVLNFDELVTLLEGTTLTVQVTNFPVEYPASSTLSECSQHAALVDNENGDGCVFAVAPSESWAYGLLLGMVLIIACLAALVVGQLRRSN